MKSKWPGMAEITEQISQQTELLRVEGPTIDLTTLRARLEAIRQFASQGLHMIEENDSDRPKLKGSAAVELPHGA